MLSYLYFSLVDFVKNKEVKYCNIIKFAIALGTTLGKVNPLSAKPTKWSNSLKQFVGCFRQIV